MSIGRSLQSFYNWLHKKFLTLNLFNSRSTDPTTIHHELLSTRLYLVTFLITLFILTGYVSIHKRIKEDIVYFPKLDLYKNLQNQYPNTLKCPCRKLAIPYGTFVNVTPLFHQVCSSNFISQSWIDFTFQTNTTFIWPMDIRTSLSAMWQLISMTCSSSIKSISDTLNQFSNLSLINSIILSEDILKTKAYTALDSTLQMISNSSMKILIAFKKISLANGLMTGISTNYILRTFSFRPNGRVDLVIPTVIRYILQGSNITCTCMNSGTCPMSGSFYLYDMWDTSGLYDLNKIISNVTLSGIIIDCTPFQMVLASSLECFYNQSCIDLILSIYSHNINISILNQSFPSRFMITTNIKILIEHLFLEKIFNETRYNSYFKQCSPIYCSYTYSSKFDGIYVLTILMSLYGGLSIGLRIIIPRIIDLILFFKRKQCCKQNNENKSIKIRLINFLNKIKISLMQFNVYNNHSEDSLEIEHDRLSTRLYLIFLISTLTITIIYTSRSIQTINKIIILPSQKQYEQLEEQYSNTLQCPCTNVSISYKEFIYVTPEYHQLCQSDFIKAYWYENFPLYEDGQWANILFVGSSHFRTLSILCDLANLTIIDESIRFNLTMFTNAHVLSRHIFFSKVDILLKKFFNSTRITFSNMILLINRFIHVNQYITSLGTNFELFVETTYPLLDLSGMNQSRIITMSRYEIINHETIYCARNSSIMLWGTSNNILIQALRTDCWIVSSVLESSLTCWYNYSCIEKFRELLAENDLFLNTNVTVLNITSPSRFPVNVRVKTLFNEIMIEQWNYSISYSDYYHKCRPVYCLYSYQKRSNIIYIIITIISIFGGLNIVSSSISSSPIKILLKINSNSSLSVHSTQTLTNNQNRRIWFCDRNQCKELLLKLMKMNLFSTGSTDINIIWREQLSTRFYLFFIIIGLCNIIIFTIISKQTSTKMISISSQTEYEKLLIQNFTTLQCPCRQISIPYKYFITVNYTFHQVCESDFVKEKWIDFLFIGGRWKNYDRIDLRSRGAAYFDFLSDLCQMSKIVVDRSIKQFLDDVFVSATMISESELNMHMNVIINQFKTNIPIRFSRDLQLLRDLAHGNTFISGYFLNWYWWLNHDIDDVTVPTNVITFKNGCSCGTRTDCIINAGIYDSNSKIQYFEIPGWNIGCSVVETLLRSTFECFYNQTCIDILNYYIETIHPKSYSSVNVTAMNSTISSHFHINTLINDIVNDLFIEEWNITVSYTAFYEQCNLTYCSYSKFKRNNFLYIISRILSLSGGLTMTLKLIIPYAIDLVLKIRNRCCRYRIAYLA